MSTLSRFSVDPSKLLLGLDHLVLGVRGGSPCPIGFGVPGMQPQGKHQELITYGGNGHLITVAPTRSGKGVSTVIPNLLLYRGPIVCVDPKGEAYQVAARRRREMGHTVIKLDPFGVVNSDTDSMNALELFQLPHSDMESDAQSLAEMLAPGATSTKDPFWDTYGRAIHAGIIASLAAKEKAEDRTLVQLIDMLQNDDVVYNLAVFLDTCGKGLNPMARREIASVLSMPDVTRGGVIATAQSYIKALISPSAQRCLAPSSFSLQDVADGKPLSIFLIIPPDRMVSHRSLLRLWLGTLMKVILGRRERPKLNTLLLIDEAAQLGPFSLLESLVTLAAGYGVWVHTIWQDLSQLRSNFPEAWKTILNNCEVIQTFGIRNRDMANQWADYLDHGPSALRRVGPDEQVLAIHGQPETTCKRLNYLEDGLFQGLFDDNRFYANSLPPRTMV